MLLLNRSSQAHPPVSQTTWSRAAPWLAFRAANSSNPEAVWEEMSGSRGSKTMARAGTHRRTRSRALIPRRSARPYQPQLAHRRSK